VRYLDRMLRKRPLGRTGLVVSELGLGTWGLSGDGYGPVAREEAEKVVRRALEIGFTLFDTADAYGAGKMEALLGELVAGEETVVIVTKIGTDRRTEPGRKRFDRAFLRHSVELSLKRLRRERLDVCLLHNPSVEALEAGEATDAMKELAHEGLIRRWGASVGDDIAGRAAIHQGAEVVELAYNLLHSIDLHRLAGEIMVAGTGVLARSTLAYGLLSGTWTKDREFAEGDHRAERWTRLELEQRVAHVEALRFLVRGDVRTLRAAATRYVLANHLVSSAVLGPRSVTQLEQLVRETGAGPRYLPDEDLARLPRALSKLGVMT
jgi:aryl-alcohol dehydrogenase-like predicted oxidoreductase